MTGPLPRGFDYFSGYGSQKRSHHRDEVLSPMDFGPGNSEAIVLVSICDPFDPALSSVSIRLPKIPILGIGYIMIRKQTPAGSDALL